MIHTIHSMTLRRYSEMEQTENTALLKRWFNPFPVGWFGVQKIIQRFADILNAGIDKHILTEVAKVIFYNKILIEEYYV